MAEENTPMNTVDKADVVIYDDGSGTQYFDDREVRTFPEGTFAWDCRTMGNRVCGPTHANSSGAAETNR